MRQLPHLPHCGYGPVKRQDLPLAYDLMASKRLQLDEVVSKVKGVMLFFLPLEE